MENCSSSKHTLGVFFYLDKPRTKNPDGWPIFCRISVDGSHINMSMKQTIAPELWESGNIIGKTKDCIRIKSFLTEVKSKIYEHYRTLIMAGKPITAQILKLMLLGKPTEEKPKIPTLVELFEEHNREIGLLVGKGTSLATVNKYKKTLSVIKEYMQSIHQIEDIEFNKINRKFIHRFEIYLKTEHIIKNRHGITSERGVEHNVAMKYLQRFKKIVVRAVSEGYITVNPFYSYPIKCVEVERGYLTSEELAKIIDKDFSITRLQRVRDLFLFSCFTGLAYIDIIKLHGKHIENTPGGMVWIKKLREKTHGRSNIPLLPVPIDIIKKYNGGTLDNLPFDKPILPVISNARLNGYLKEIAAVCGIKKNLTFHTARHTFATTVTLTNGVPIETVSSMMGHSNIKMTQHYAKIVTSKIARDMKNLEKMLTDKTLQAG